MPTYETQADIEAERRFAHMLEAKGWSMQSMPQYYPFDFFATRNNISSFVEYKKRTHASNTFPNTFFPADKFAKCRSYARELGLPFYIFIEWEDQIGYCNAMQISFNVCLAGRNDRGDLNRFKPMVNIDIGSFNKF